MPDGGHGSAGASQDVSHNEGQGEHGKEWATACDAAVGMIIPGHSGLLSLCNAHLSPLPPTAQILCVGAGTGREILYLAERHSGALHGRPI